MFSAAFEHAYHSLSHRYPPKGNSSGTCLQSQLLGRLRQEDCLSPGIQGQPVLQSKILSPYFSDILTTQLPSWQSPYLPHSRQALVPIPKVIYPKPMRFLEPTAASSCLKHFPFLELRNPSCLALLLLHRWLLFLVLPLPTPPLYSKG
jgi:hypothetical protein